MLFFNFIQWVLSSTVGSVLPLFLSIALESLSHVPKCKSSSPQTFLIAMYWLWKSWMSGNLSWYSFIRFIWAKALLCLTFRLLVLPVYTSFLITASSPIELSFFSRSRYLVALSTWLLVSESHCDISITNIFQRFPSSILSVFISSPIWFSHVGSMIIRQLRNFLLD